MADLRHHLIADEIGVGRQGQASESPAMGPDVARN
jgi:hypothetical protein